MKKIYQEPLQNCIELNLEGTVAQGGGLGEGSINNGVPGDAGARSERDFDEDRFASGSTTNVWEKLW
ncbi:MAG: hypothetical protein KBT12_03480 [Bacteroidales bacterium]|nr:hypothetical protein [Candidatus Physcousia equi]